MAPPSSPSSTIELCGDVMEDMTLLRGHTYVITCTLVVKPDAVLDVEAGTMVLILPKADNVTLPTSFVELLAHYDRRGTPRALSAQRLQAASPDDCAVDEREWSDEQLRENNLAYILVERGGQLHARGTAEAPITFTLLNESAGSAVSDTDSPQHGVAWGGVVLMGRAPIAAERSAPTGRCWDGNNL